MSTILTPVTIPYLQNLKCFHYSGASFNNLPSLGYYSSSVIDCSTSGYFKRSYWFPTSGSLTSKSQIYFLDYSYDGITGWHGASVSSLATLTGSLASINCWRSLISFSSYSRFVRVIIRNLAEGAISGSLALYGYNYT